MALSKVGHVHFLAQKVAARQNKGRVESWADSFEPKRPLF